MKDLDNEIEYMGGVYDLRDVDDRLALQNLGYFDKDKNKDKNKKGKTKKIVYEDRKDSLPLNTEYIQVMDYKYYGLVTLMSKFNGETACDIKGVGIENAENHRYFYEDWL